MQCSRCKQHFKYASLLQRHLSKKKQCEMLEIVDHCDNKHQCKYCRKPSATKQGVNRHEQTCKFKEDHVRNLEIELCVIPTYSYCKDQCRFCNKDMRADVVRRHEGSCKEKEAYKIELMNMKSEGGQSSEGTTTNVYNITNNITINTNTINVQLRAYGEENLEYITPDVMARIMKRAMCQYTGDTEKRRFIGLVYKEIFANEKHPENHNMMIRSMNRSTAKVWNGKEFEDRHRKEVEERALLTIANVTSDNYYSEPEKFVTYHSFCGRYIVGDEAIDNDTPKEMTKNRRTIAYTSHKYKPLVKKTQKELTRINLTENPRTPQRITLPT